MCSVCFLCLIGIVDLIEDADESAMNVYQNLTAVIQKSGLNPNGLTSIGADNTNVNMGNHHSVFSLFSTDVCNLIKGKRIESMILILLSHIIFASSRKLLLSYSAQRCEMESSAFDNKR